MSRPVYEPSLTRTDQALGWGTRQLARRPAPQSAEDTQFAFLSEWEAEGTGEVSPDVWTPVVSPGFAFYNEGYESSPAADGGFDVDLVTGNILCQADTLYWAMGWIMINETLAAGEILAGAIFDTVNDSERVINQLTAGAGGAISQEKLFIGAPLWSGISMELAVRIYHDSASTVTIREANINVMKLGPLLPGNFIIYGT